MRFNKIICKRKDSKTKLVRPSVSSAKLKGIRRKWSCWPSLSVCSLLSLISSIQLFSPIPFLSVEIPSSRSQLPARTCHSAGLRMIIQVPTMLGFIARTAIFGWMCRLYSLQASFWAWWSSQWWQTRRGGSSQAAWWSDACQGAWFAWFSQFTIESCGWSQLHNSWVDSGWVPLWMCATRWQMSFIMRRIAKNPSCFI